MGGRYAGRGAVVGKLAGVAALATVLAGCEQPWSSELVTVDGAGTGAVGVQDMSPIFSPDGSKVLFVTTSGDLGPVDTNGELDVYLRDVAAGTTELVSVNHDGTDSGDAYSWGARFTDDGRYVAFLSGASDLGPPGQPGGQGAYLHDLAAGTTVPVSLSDDGDLVPALGFDMSSDGSAIAFVTDLSLDPNDANSGEDVYVRAEGTTRLVSVDATGAALGYSYDAGFSPDGTHLIFENAMQGLMEVDLEAQTTTLLAPEAADHVYSSDGTKVAYTSPWDGHGFPDPNDGHDVFVQDLATGAVTLVSRTASGFSAGDDWSYVHALSPDGTKVLFTSDATDLVAADTNAASDVFVHDLTTGATTLVSANDAGTDSGNGMSIRPSFSADGKKVAFVSGASNLGPTDTTMCTRYHVFPPRPPIKYFVNCPDVYVHELATATTTMVSTRADRSDGANEESTWATFSPTSTAEVAFTTRANDLGGPDTGTLPDMYLARLDETP